MQSMKNVYMQIQVRCIMYQVIAYNNQMFDEPPYYHSSTLVPNIVHQLGSTPVPQIHVLSNITPLELRRQMAARKEWKKCFEDIRGYELPIKNDLANPPLHRLPSRSALIRCRNQSRYFSNKHLVDYPDQKLEGFDLPRRKWKMLNRFRFWILKFEVNK